MRHKTVKAANGENLARVRKAAGLTQEDLAREMQMHRTTIAAYEAGLDTLDARTVLAAVAVIARLSKTSAVSRGIEEVWTDITGRPWGSPSEDWLDGTRTYQGGVDPQEGA